MGVLKVRCPETGREVSTGIEIDPESEASLTKHGRRVLNLLFAKSTAESANEAAKLNAMNSARP